MILVNNHHVIVPHIEDLIFTSNTTVSSDSDIINIELFGDSIMCGRDPDVVAPIGGVCVADTTTARVPIPPSELIKIYLPQYIIRTNNRSAGGSTSSDLLNGTDGVNAAWPDQINANIVIINHGFNDARLGVSLNDYKSNLIEIREKTPPGIQIIWQTPTPNLFFDTSAYADAMIEVANLYSDIAADTRKIINWTSRLPDGIHPRQFGYCYLINYVLSPEINKAILKHFSHMEKSIYRRNHLEKHIISNSNEIRLNHTPLSGSWVEIYKKDTYSYRITSRGDTDLYGKSPAGIFDYNLNPDDTMPIYYSGRGYNITKIDRSTGKTVFHKSYNIIDDPVLATLMAEELNKTTSDYIIIVTTQGDAQPNRLDSFLLEAMLRCGASSTIYQSTYFKKGSSYILIGIPGYGEGTGYEAYSGETDDPVISYCEIIMEISTSGFPHVLDIFPAVATVYDPATETSIKFSDPTFDLLKHVSTVDGFRVLNAKYMTFYSQGVFNEVYNVFGNTIVFNSNITGTFTVITDTYLGNNDYDTAGIVSIHNIQNLNNYVQRFNPLPWARGSVNVKVVTNTISIVPPAVVQGASGVNNLSTNIYNTKLISRVGDAFYSEPVVITQPNNGYVRITPDRKSFIYVPFPDFQGYDAFSYTLVTQRGQSSPPHCVYVQVL